MDMQEILDLVKSEARVTESHIGTNNRFIIGLMTIGGNIDIELYWFDLLERLEELIDSRIYFSEGAIGEYGDSFLDLQSSPAPIEVKRNITIKYIKDHFFTALEGRLVCAKPEDEAKIFGIERRDLFMANHRAYALAMTQGPDNSTRLDLLSRRIRDLARQTGNSYQSWEQGVAAARQFARLSITPSEITNLRNRLYSDSDTMFPWYDELVASRRQYSLDAIDANFIVKLRECMQPAVDFYDVVQKRTPLMAEIIDERWQALDETVVYVYVTGFHWDVLQQEFKQRGYSYCIVTPDTNFQIAQGEVHLEAFDKLMGNVLPLSDEFRWVERPVEDDDIWDDDIEIPSVSCNNVVDPTDLEPNDHYVSLVNEALALNDIDRLAHLVWAKGKVLLEGETPVVALFFFEEAIDLFARVQDYWCLANAYELMGEIELVKENNEEAKQYFLNAIDAFQNAEDASGEARLHYTLGGQQLVWGEENGLDHLEEAIRLYTIVSDFDSLADTLILKGAYCEEQKNYAEAEALYNRVLKIYEKADNKIGIRDTHIKLARIGYKREGGIPMEHIIESARAQGGNEMVETLFEVLTEHRKNEER